VQVFLDIHSYGLLSKQGGSRLHQRAHRLQNLMTSLLAVDPVVQTERERIP